MTALYAVSRTRGAGRFTYSTPRWPDARSYLVALLAEDGTRRARTVAARVPATPPARPWSARIGGDRYELARVDLGGGVG